MIYKFFKKIRKIVSLLIVFCVTVPLIGACGDNDNKLKESRQNPIIGKGRNIEAYSTYAQAQFIEMDKDMYYSYLLSMRDFILVVLPEGECSDTDGDGNNDKCYPKSDNLMFSATYNGVIPYAEEVIDGNFLLHKPEYKILIYYVLVDDFLSWEEAANKEDDKGFIENALDFLGPSDADNYETHVEVQNGMITEIKKTAKVVRNEEQYNLKNIVNAKKYVSECDFLRVDSNYNIVDYSGIDSTALDKCGDKNHDNKPDGKNVIANVAKGTSEGVTLLYGEGALYGYFIDDDVRAYSFDDVEWIKELIQVTGSTSIEDYIRKSARIYLLCDGANRYEDFCSTSSINTYVNQSVYKFRYDMSLLGRIKKINYNTILDFNASTKVTESITQVTSVDEYSKILDGTTSKGNKGDYLAFTTADGFIIDRGNIVMQAGEDFLFNTNFLEMMTQMDACTNRTLASYLAEVLADVGIGVGGIAVAVGLGVLAYAGVAAVTHIAAVSTVLAAVGATSLSVPGVGWIVGAALLLVAGGIALYASISTKKAINDTNSANFCEVYKEAMGDILAENYLKIPIYGYNIEKDENFTAELCYEDYVFNPAVGREQCGSEDENGNFVPSTYSVPAFYMAKVTDVDKLKQLTGSPSIRLYSDGRFIDEIYGASSWSYIYAILDSWGVTSAAYMKFYATTNKDYNGNVTGFSIYDLLASDSERQTTLEKIEYCASIEHNKACANPINANVSGYGSFSNGVKNISLTSAFSNQVQSIRDTQIAKLRTENELDYSKVRDYKSQLLSIANRAQVRVENESGLYYVVLNGSRYRIYEELGEYYLSDGSTRIDIFNGTFIYGDATYSFTHNEGGYYVKCLAGSISEFTNVSNGLKYLMGYNADFEIDQYIIELQEKITDNASIEDIESHINGIAGRLNGIAYCYKYIPIYFTANILEKNTDGEDITTNASSIYSEEEIKLTFDSSMV